MFKNVIIVYVLLLNSLYAEDARTIHLESGDTRNTLIELYTSEGCSSCPPAEEYLNKLKSDKNLWKKWVPVALHVQYWDYIGWKDQYATSENGKRQSRYASLKRASTVYTPAFMVNGSSWRRGRIFSNSLPEDNSSAGRLIVEIKDKVLKARYEAKNKSSLKLNIAVLAMNLTSQIERGENEGRTAHHEFVVVGFDEAVSDNRSWKMKLPQLHFTKAKSYALAVWVSTGNNPTPLQAVGGYLPNYKP